MRCPWAYSRGGSKSKKLCGKRDTFVLDSPITEVANDPVRLYTTRIKKSALAAAVRIVRETYG